MQRRSFLQLLGLLIPFKPSKRYGLLTIERYHMLRARHNITLRVIVDGKDVTNRCREADDVAGYATCFLENEKGQLYIDYKTNTVAIKKCFGDVRFIRGDERR